MVDWLLRMFRARSSVHATTQAELFQALRDTRARVEMLEDELEKLKSAHVKLRGRVYAEIGAPRNVSEAIEAPKPLEELPLTDPRLTKAQLRQRLLQPGKRFKHTN